MQEQKIPEPVTAVVDVEDADYGSRLRIAALTSLLGLAYILF